jgi:hypothetical protein
LAFSLSSYFLIDLIVSEIAFELTILPRLSSNQNIIIGNKAIDFYARQFLVTLLFVALTRVENGVSGGLAKVNPTAFN